MSEKKKSIATTDWAAYISQMESVLALDLDDARRLELLAQFSRIAQMAQSLMDLPLDPRLEFAGVYRA